MEQRTIYAVVYILKYEGDQVEFHSTLESAVEQQVRLGAESVIVPINTSPGRLVWELNSLGTTAREILAEQEEG